MLENTNTWDIEDAFKELGNDEFRESWKISIDDVDWNGVKQDPRVS